GAAVEAVRAGVDVLLVCHHAAVQHRVLDALVAAARKGHLSEERLRDAHARIDALVQRFVRPAEDRITELGSAEHRRMVEDLGLGTPAVAGRDPTVRRDAAGWGPPTPGRPVGRGRPGAAPAGAARRGAPCASARASWCPLPASRPMPGAPEPPVPDWSFGPAEPVGGQPGARGVSPDGGPPLGLRGGGDDVAPPRSAAGPEGFRSQAPKARA